VPDPNAQEPHEHIAIDKSVQGIHV